MPFDQTGLTSAAARANLEKFGPNVLPEKPPPSAIAIFISQLKNPLVYVLLGAGLVTIAIRHFSDAAIIFLAVLINTVLGFVQESRAGKSIYALKKMLQSQASVIRDGIQIKIATSEIVPEDLVIISQGDKIPADGELIHANRLFVAEAILTGEASPIAKHAKHTVFMGTTVTGGRGVFKVTVTGNLTKMGEIATSVQEPEEVTPLKLQLSTLGKNLAILVLILTIGIFLFGAALGKDPYEIFLISVALAVSAIPEGLLVSLTVVLAIGMQRIARRKGLVRNLVSAETLGGVTTICVDKTGTLTKGQMQVTQISGDANNLSKQAVLANDLDDPIVVAAWEWAQKYTGSQDLLKVFPRLDSIPFSSKDRFFASLHSAKTNNILYVNGAWEYLLAWSTLSKNEKEKTKQEIVNLSSQGMRIMGMAQKLISKKVTKVNTKTVRQNLVWNGYLAFSDPPRESVTKSLELAQKAGIRILVITGDYSDTAISVMRAVGLRASTETTIVGEELTKLDTGQLQEKLKSNNINLFARTLPEQKLKIVQALKQNGEVVAMMGDGVNDAPALKQADIGIVVASASDVAKESSDLVLLDSNFKIIIAAIEEGRGIFENIRKIAYYLMSNAFAEIFAIVGALILNLPLPVAASQILWINLVSDGTPNLALTVEKKRKSIINEPPRDPSEKLFNRFILLLTLAVSAISGLGALIIFTHLLNNNFSVEYARSAAFASLGMTSLVFVFSARVLQRPIWKQNILDNPWLLLAFVGGIVAQLLPFASSRLRTFFGMEIIQLSTWLLVSLVPLTVLIIVELVKIIFKRNKKMLK